MASSSSSSSPEISAAETHRDSYARFSYRDATQDEVLEDLSSRFILNLPDEELNSLERVCFQVEQAHWYYEDFVREENTKLPSMSLKKFSEMLFYACPLLQQWSHDHEEAFKHFMQYKTRVPVCGAIMLNDTMDKCVLVKGWKASSNWGFPKGKINETEPPALCAIREVLEETGYNLAGQLDPANVIELTIKEQKISLFIVHAIPEDFNFQTKTRKEISQISWFKLSDLPTWKRKSQVPNGKFYLISPFIGPLKIFIREKRQRSEKNIGNQGKMRSDKVNGSDYTNGAHPHNMQLQAREQSRPVNTNENEWGPELTRLFSGLTAMSNNSDKGHVPNGSSNGLKAGESSSDDPSDYSIDSPLAARAQSSTISERSQTNVRHPPPRPTLNGSSASPSNSDSVPTMKSAAPPISPSKPASSVRRASGPADISPYLSRKSELPVSAKTLQHLQLLENVADESARMALILAARAALVKQVASSSAATPFPTSPQVQSMSRDPFSSVSHPSGVGLAPRLPTEDLGAYPTYPNPYHLRSRTSQALNRPTMHNPTGSLSMHQNHLLAVINGARTAPLTSNYPMNQQVTQQPLFNVGMPAVPSSNLGSYPSSSLHSHGPLPPPNFVQPASSPVPFSVNPLAFSHNPFAPVYHPMVPTPNPLSAPSSNRLASPPIIFPANANINANLISGVNTISLPVPNPLLSILNDRPT